MVVRYNNGGDTMEEYLTALAIEENVKGINESDFDVEENFSNIKEEDGDDEIEVEEEVEENPEEDEEDEDERDIPIDEDILEKYKPNAVNTLDSHSITEMELSIMLKEKSKLEEKYAYFSEQFQIAAEGGDVSESANYSTMKEGMNRISAQLTKLNQFLDSAYIGNPPENFNTFKILDKIWIYIPEGGTEDTMDHNKEGKLFMFTSPGFGSPIEEIGDTGACSLDISSPIGRRLFYRYKEISEKVNKKEVYTEKTISGVPFYVTKIESKKG